MKLNVDKEVLKKHHYWLVAGGALLFSIVAIFILRTGVRANIAAEKKKVETSFDTLKKQAGGEVKSRAAIAQKKAKADAIKSLEVVVWSDAFKQQEDLVRFADDVEAAYHFSRDLVTGEIGNFANSIIIHKDDQELDPVAADGNTFKGVVVKGDDVHVRVKGKIKTMVPSKIKDEEPKEVISDRELVFFNTPGLKVTTEKDGEAAGRLVIADVRAPSKVTVQFDRGRYFYDPLTSQEQLIFSQSYEGQFRGIVEQVQPITIEEKGVVQLGNGAGGFEPYDPEKTLVSSKYIHIVDKASLIPGQDISELAWIAQENVWIQREIYRLVAQANSYVGAFEQTEEEKKKKSPWVGRNAYWEAKLEMKGDDQVQVTLTNQLPRRQALGVILLVWFKDSKQPERIPVSGASARAPKGSGGASSYTTTMTPEWIDDIDRKEIVKVEQELRWDLAAVKRIDEIGIGADAFATPHSHRTFPLGLKPFKEEKKPEGAAEGDPMGGPGMPPGMGGGVRPPGGVVPPDGKGGDGGQGGMVPAGKFRYVEVSPQARRVPIVVSLIVDQQHVDRVQTSFANSKLRFLTTQVLMNRYPFSLNPNLNKKAEAGFDGGPGMGPMPPGGGPRPPGMGPMPPPGGGPIGGPPGPGMPGPGMPGPGDGAASGSEDLEANVELVIYGVVTLYERYPPKTAVAAPPPEK